MKKSELKALIKEVISEATGVSRVDGKYIYFVDSSELYSLKPYKQIGNHCDIKLANNWTRVKIMQGEDVRDILGQQVPDTTAWYIINNAPSDHVFDAYIGK